MVEGHVGYLFLAMIFQDMRGHSWGVVGHHVVDVGAVNGVDVLFLNVLDQVLKSNKKNDGHVDI